MEIEINDTPATNDDVVALKCLHPPHRPTVNCRIRVKKPTPGVWKVVLTNPDGRLRFPGVKDTTKVVSVPGDGSWAHFKISGENHSNAKDDAVIQAHCRTAKGPIVATKLATVFWFNPASITIAAGGHYGSLGGRYTVTAGNAVNFSAEATIKPAGIDCSVPQVKNLRVGIMQNAISPTLSQTYNNPAIAWVPGVPIGTTVTVPAMMRVTSSYAATANDTEGSVAPLYDQPGKTGTLDPNSLKPPIGCAGGGSATSHDTPSTPMPPTLTLPATGAAGAILGTITYNLANAQINATFRTWVVIYNIATHDYCALRQATWSVHANSASHGAQSAAAGHDSSATVNPVTAPTANTLVNSAASHTQGPVGGATTTFTR